MSKHTPGPWITDDDTEVIAKIPSDSPNKSSPDILTICRAVDVEIYADNRSGSTAANARLIAAAPDMYTLIKAEYDANHGFETLPLGYPRERAEAISNIVKAVEGGAA
jgi:hypothetical protein